VPICWIKTVKQVPNPKALIQTINPCRLYSAGSRQAGFIISTGSPIAFAYIVMAFRAKKIVWIAVAPTATAFAAVIRFFFSLYFSDTFLNFLVFLLFFY
jgi:hypothetical protein